MVIRFPDCIPEPYDVAGQCFRCDNAGNAESGFAVSNIPGDAGAVCTEPFLCGVDHRGYGAGSAVLGEKDEEAVERVLAITLKASMLVSFVFFLSAFCVPGLLMRIFTNEIILIEKGIPYLRIVSWSYLFMGVSQIYLCIMKNSGRTARSTLYGSVALGLNIILNSVLIFGLFGFPKLEIEGTAAATVISRLLELALVIWENRKRNVVRIRPGLLLQGGDDLKKDFVKYTSPVLANELVWGCGITMVSVIMGHLGNDAVAANSIASIVKNIISCVCLGIGAGSSIIIGNELGKGNLEQAKEYGGKLCRTALAAGVLSGLFLLLSSPFILRFSGNLTKQAQEYLQVMLYICSYYLIGKAMNATVVGGIFCAGGDTGFGFLCDTVTMWVIIVPMGLIAAFVLDLPVLWVYFLLNLDEFVKLPVVYCHYKKYKWVKNLTEKRAAV